jgi:hypothetical protein
MHTKKLLFLIFFPHSTGRRTTLRPRPITSANRTHKASSIARSPGRRTGTAAANRRPTRSAPPVLQTGAPTLAAMESRKPAPSPLVDNYVVSLRALSCTLISHLRYLCGSGLHLTLPSLVRYPVTSSWTSPR